MLIISKIQGSAYPGYRVNNIQDTGVEISGYRVNNIQDTGVGISKIQEY